MAVSEINKCPNCGGQLEETEDESILRCSSCDSEFDSGSFVKPAPGGANYAGDGFTKTEWFDFRVAYKALLKGSEAKTILGTFAYCVNELGTSEAIIKYIKREMSDVAGICYEHHNEEKMKAFIKRAAKDSLEPDEKVLFYANSGIFSSGKKGFLVTDKKIIFCEKKPQAVWYSDLQSIAFEVDSDFTFVRFNSARPTSIITVDGGGDRPHGAFAALACALAFEEDPNRDRIVICKYDDGLDDE